MNTPSSVQPSTGATPLRVLFVLPGLHQVHRGAEAAFEAVAAELARSPAFHVTLMGAGQARPGTPYAFIHVPMTARNRFEHWPRVPPLRSDYRYEELSFVPGLWRRYRPADYDVTVTCSYPFVNWVLRIKKYHGRRPTHVFVTENGDWPARRLNSEYRWFGCEGLVCTNPDYHERHRSQWNCALIPNGMDATRFTPGPGARRSFGIPDEGPVILMVSALIPSKHVLAGIRAAAGVAGACLVVAGDGPLREECRRLGQQLLGSRYHSIPGVPPERMPDLYRSANIFMHLSREEAFGNVYIEALACGLPVVAHDYPVTRWILGEQGRRVNTEFPALITAALADELTAATTAEVAAARHAAAATRFAWPPVAGLYADFLLQLPRRL